MDPPAGKWLFFVAIDKQGHSAFAETDAQHEANKGKCRARPGSSDPPASLG